ncbi:MAG: methylenetetrahydrofolate reductase [Pseudomonadota bacterium]|nr:methylenetetrahydrofolate reductase [Pseudomonadota bacterium]
MAKQHETSTPSTLETRLLASQFAITAEITPPVSADSKGLLAKAEILRGLVDAVNVTDGASARVHMASNASAAILALNGIEPIAQFTCRDRNRIALLSDLLGVGAFGVNNLLMLGGDDPSAGDQPEAKAVFDYTSIDLIKVASMMTEKGCIPSVGVGGGPADVDTKQIEGSPKFFVGAADVPSSEKVDGWVKSLRAKQNAGASFIQTQLCYDMKVVKNYAKHIIEEGFSKNMYFLIGNGPLSSAKSAAWMRDNLWGVIMPDIVVERLAKAKDAKSEGIRICIEQVEELSDISGVAGVHLMSPLNTGSIPEVIKGLPINIRIT